MISKNRELRPSEVGKQVPVCARTIAFFGHDSTESTVVKRATAFRANGSRVIGFMFRRLRRGAAREPAWENIELGVTQDLNYLRRLVKLLAAIPKTFAKRVLLRQCEIIYARNLDMLFLAVAAKKLTGTQAVVVYEALDIRHVFVGRRPLNRLFRWVERKLLDACDMLVVSSPDFVSRYYEPVQGYHGRWRLLENKILTQQFPAGQLAPPLTPPPGPPWIVGFFGVLRCVRSLEILRRTAEVLPDQVIVHIRGQPSEADIPLRTLEDITERYPNIHFFGPYKSPENLGTIYGKVHFTWAIDFLEAGFNSEWLLPNRLYEGGLFESVALAKRGTAAGRMIERHGLGWTLSEPLENTVAAFFANLDNAAYERKRAGIAETPCSLFVDETDTRDLLSALDELATSARVGSRSRSQDQRRTEMSS